MNPVLAIGIGFATWLVFSVVATVLWIIACEVSERRTNARYAAMANRSGRVRGQR